MNDQGSQDDVCLRGVKQVSSQLRFKRVTEAQICKIVENLKPKSSTGPDGVSNNLLKKLVHVIKCPLCVIFNKSLQSGVFPDLMKLAKVIPIFKAGDPMLCDNYRPISLLLVISKVLEKIVYYNVTKHLDVNGILYPRQYGFWKNYSTSDAIMNFIGETLKALDSKQLVLSIFIDLKKVFDTVSHKRVLKKLEQLGIWNCELDWFASYLSNRKQYVDIDGSLSYQKNLSVGIPQGSLLGVLLFQILIDRLPRCLKFSQCILYADDTTIFLMGRSLQYLRLKLQQDLDNISSWLCDNHLKLNVSKTKTMMFSVDGLIPDYNLFINGEKLEVIIKFKFLGVLLDVNLSFEHHYKLLHDKLLKSTFVIRSLSHFLSLYCLRTLYFTHYHSHLVQWPWLTS